MRSNRNLNASLFVFGVAGAYGFFTIGWLWGGIPLSGLALVAVVIKWRTDTNYYRLRQRVPTIANGAVVHWDDYQTRRSRFNLDGDQILLLIDGVINRSEIVYRAKELHRLRTHTVERTLRLEFTRYSSSDLIEGSMMVPILLSKKGLMRSRFSVAQNGQEIQTLNFEDSVVVFADVIDMCLAVSGVQETARRDILHDVVRVISSRTAPGLGSSESDDLVRRIRNVVGPGIGDSAAILAIALIKALEEVYVIIADLTFDSGHAMAEVHEFLTFVASDAPAVRFMQALVGTTPSSYEVNVDESIRARSYHLEVIGPPETYHSRTEILDLPPETSEGNLHISSRRGQRLVHVYARWRGSRVVSYKPMVAIGFLERLPGLLAGAWISAAAMTFLTWRLSDSKELESWLLVIPGILIAATSVRSMNSITGGVTVARASLYFTTLSSIVGVVMGERLLLWILFLSCINLLLVSYWMIPRLRLHARMYKKQ